MQQTFLSFIAHYGYAAVFLLIMLEDFGMPVPGETALIVAAAAAAAGRLNIAGVLVAAFLGALVGDNIGYAIGHFGGRVLVIRVGGKVGITAERYEYAEGFFNRYGDIVIVGARFVEILRQLNGIVAGTLGMDWRRFFAFNALGAALWVGVWGAAGYFAGEHIAQVHALFRRFTWLAVTLAVLAILTAVAVQRMRRHRRPEERDPAE